MLYNIECMNLLYIFITSQILTYFVYKFIFLLEGELIKDSKIYVIIDIFILICYLLIYNKYGLSVETIKYFYLIPYLLIISIIDLYTINVYDITIVSGIIIQGIILIISVVYGLTCFEFYISDLIKGAIITYLLCKLTRSMGLGDVTFFCLIFFTIGKGNYIYIIELSFLIAFFYFVCKILFRKKLDRQLPFTPFISIASLLIVLTGNKIFDFYFDIVDMII